MRKYIIAKSIRGRAASEPTTTAKPHQTRTETKETPNGGEIQKKKPAKLHQIEAKERPKTSKGGEIQSKGEIKRDRRGNQAAPAPHRSCTKRTHLKTTEVRIEILQEAAGSSTKARITHLKTTEVRIEILQEAAGSSTKARIGTKEAATRQREVVQLAEQERKYTTDTTTYTKSATTYTEKTPKERRRD